MTRALRIVAIVAGALAFGGCAHNRYHEEEPHHYSRDVDGRRIACYSTDVANEYDCVPVVRRYPRAYHHNPYYDPWWPHLSMGFYYGWPHWYVGSVWYPRHWHHHHHWRHRRR